MKNATYLDELNCVLRELCLIESVEGNMYVQKRIECFKCAYNFWISKSISCAFSAWVAMLPGQAGSWEESDSIAHFFQVENRPCQRAYGSWRWRGWCGGGPPGSWRRGGGSGSRGTRPRRAWWGSWTKRTRSTTNGRSAWIEDRCRMGRRVLRAVWGKRTVFRPNCHLAIFTPIIKLFSRNLFLFRSLNGLSVDMDIYRDCKNKELRELTYLSARICP